MLNNVGATIGRPPWRNRKNNICGQSRTPVPTVKIEEYHCLSRKYATFAVVGANNAQRNSRAPFLACGVSRRPAP